MLDQGHYDSTNSSPALSSQGDLTALITGGLLDCCLKLTGEKSAGVLHRHSLKCFTWLTSQSLESNL